MRAVFLALFLMSSAALAGEANLEQCSLSPEVLMRPEGPLYGFTTEGIKEEYPTGYLLKLTLHNETPDQTKYCRYETEGGPVLVYHFVTGNIEEGCCKDRLKVISRPKGTYVLPSEEIEVEEGEEGELLILWDLLG